jgi:predicted ArsR family transcriptional regulator
MIGGRYNMRMKTSRQRLLEYLQTRYPISAAELSQALRMTEANARYHLGILIEQGLVEIVGQRSTPGKGRPIHLYSPARQSLGENLDQLASALLQELQSQLAPQEQAVLLQQVARRLMGPSTQNRGSSHLTQRLYHAIQQLNVQHYQARWEAHRDAPRLILEHCPYAAILPQHPELCQMDSALLEGLLGAPVEQIARLAPDARGLPHCVFLIRSPLKSGN